MSFMSIPTALQEYNDGSLTQKYDGLRRNYPHHRFIMEGRDNANGIYAFNRFEEKRFVEWFLCHFKLVDLPCDALYDLATPATQE